MNLLLDTHLLLWAAGEPQRLSATAQAFIEDRDNRLYFSAASLWEIVIKNGLQRPDFKVDPHLLRRGLVENGYTELPITAAHTLAVSHLPPLHRDPFDRILVAQAESEGIALLTSDEQVAQYPGPIQKV
ncbi:type II toxin-antitoxin system VapC family toxin [Mangrovimicrobium sediminis]|uniref:Type II toxin-antitoxin system VapC family toxin n=1 Tax=Mangrovimicrobium sediminis TaxID=2562682 RepID=A0A4Z0LXW3_9GAMM|nr:type II toxin-antitoxin system VapC family toxin [Haliea sp. SAOS-164]TGD72213.1 type II toxin-antitoxin system VapC family toxin [Haliea sp. SAOS-164]